MSDAPSDREEASDAPEGARSNFGSYLWWASFALVLYVLSIGPVWALYEQGYISGLVRLVYFPVVYLPDDIQTLVVRYIKWWMP